MAINIKFDLTGNPEPPTILLANRSGNILGQLDVETESIDMSDKFNDASEFSFTLYKYVDNKITNLWDKVVDFKLVYCKEWDEWFEITVELDESTETIKTVFCTQLEKAELSQLNLYNIEINTEKDIERDDYKICILYDNEDANASILNRLLKDKAPHYSIVHVDATIAKIQRSFSFDGTSIEDAFQEIAEEIGCVFIYHSYKDEDGILRRTISVYDLQQNCKDCGHRAEFTDKCPKCGSTNITNGYGEDTLIFVTSDELASDGIELVTDVDSVKNCFKLEAGDDLMTATVRNCNPNGTDYIWYFSSSMKEDMSDELVEKLESYNTLYQYYYSDSEYSVNEGLLGSFNKLIDKYSIYNEELQKIEVPVKGYSSLTKALYNTIDLELYLRSALMPSVKMSDTTAIEQARLLTSSALSPVAVANITTASLATMNSAVLTMAKIIVKPTYKIQVNDSETYNQNNKRYWKGNFVITNYSDEEDTATSSVITVEVNDDLETSLKQQIEKALNKENTDDMSITGLFEKEYDDFCAELKKYALNPLISFRDACQTCINILIEQGVGDEEEDLYDGLYVPYYNKMGAIESEIKIREDEINIILGVYDIDGKLISNGLQAEIEKCQEETKNELDFEKYLGEKLWIEFCSYRREDVYSNDNYISDGLNNTEIFKRAMEFFEVAEKEIYKSSESQHSISTTLNNLLAIPKFKSLVEYFKVGNWIRVRVDDMIFKLRLLEYEISYGDFNNISVEFSDVVKIKDGVTDVRSVIEQAKSMATSYSSVKRQATQGNEAKDTLEDWSSGGLNSALVRIIGNDHEDVKWDKNGLLCRSYDDVTETYSPEQFRLTHNIMAYTTDNWETVSAALGKHDYVYYDGNKVKQTATDYGLTAKFVSAGYISGSQIIGGEIYSENYTSTTGTYLDLNNGNFSWAGGKIKYDGNNVTLKGVNLTWEDIGDAPTKISAFENDADYKNGTQVTQITKDTVTTSYVNALKVTAGSVAAENITGTTITGKTISGGTVSGATITGGSLNIGNGNFVVTSAGKMTAKSGDIAGNLTISGSLAHTRGNYTVTLRAVQPTVTNGVFYITDKTSGSNVYPFIINGDGSFRATKATISGDSTFGGTLNAADGSFKGKLSAVSGTFTSLSAGKSTFSEKQVKIATPSAKDADGSIYIGDSGVNGWEDITIRPSSDNLGNIGTSGKSWDMLYVKNGVVHSSDRNKKKDIAVMGEKQEKLFNLLSPVIFKFIDNTYDRFHYGFISQEVEEAIEKCGLTTKDFAGFCKDIKLDDDNNPVLDKDGNQEYVYSLRYTEFIALNTHMIKRLQAENKELKERLDLLESKL